MWTIITALAIVGATAYVWCTRGFFSGLIHLICVIAAGAIAFGVWELVADLIRENSPASGSFAWISGAAMGLALALPFAASIAVLRGFVDKLLPANAQCEKTVDYIGGGICGAAAGIISAGIVVLSMGFMRFSPDFFGYAQASYTGGVGRGSIEKNKETFVPWVDRIVAGMYSHLSKTTLRTGDPLAKYHPDLATYPGELRVTFDGKSRNSIARKDVSLLSSYTVGENSGRGAPIQSLLSDAWSEHPQKVTDLAGESYTGNFYLAGYTLKFKASARERTGSFYVGNAQVRLVIASTDDEENPETRAIHPIAVVCRTDSARRVAYARFRYDSDNMFISSVGAESEPTIAFEFPVEAGYKPLALYIKGVRFNLESNSPFKKYASPSERDAAIEAGEFPNMGGIGPILDDQGRPVQEAQGANPGPTANPVTVSASVGFTIQKGTEGGDLAITNEDGKGWAIQDGKTKLSTAQLNNQNLEKPLRIDRFVVNADTAIVQVVLTPSQRSVDFMKILEAADTKATPLLEDTNGTTYQAVGYVYRDPTKAEVRYTQQNPIKEFGEVPRVTRNTPDKTLKLIFVVNNGVDLVSFKIGEDVLDRWPSNRPFHVDMPIRR